MWQIDQYNKESVDKWINNNLEKNIFQIHPDSYIHTTPIEIEVTVQVSLRLIKLYNQYEEKGGIIFCSLNCSNGKTIIKTEFVCDVPNIDENKTNTYAPNDEIYLKLLNENFSNQNHSQILLPIHFHTHPTKDLQEAISYSQLYFITHFKLNTSEGDQNVVKLRFLEFDKIKVGYFHAIITGHDLFLNIIFYAHNVTPLDFLEVKRKLIHNAFKEFGDEFSKITDNPEKKGIIKKGLRAMGKLAGNSSNIDELASLYDGEYFGMLKENESTIISIPQFCHIQT